MTSKIAIYLVFQTLFIWSSVVHSQAFRVERPVPDSIQSHGNYLYGEPWFWASGGAHRGLDMWVVYDTVYSATDGYVEFAAFAPGDDGYEPDGFGNYLRTRSTWNSNTIYTYYAHLSKLLVNTGASISTGQPIAISGNTGNSSGPHLHFEIRENNSNYLAEKTRRNPELWFTIKGMGAIYGRVPNADDNTRVNISPDPKPRPPYTTFSYGLTYGFYDKTIGSDDVYKENYAFGDVKPGTYTITALDGDYTRVVNVKAGEIVNADAVVSAGKNENKTFTLNLEQNYPNPFNPSTIIKYQIPLNVKGETANVKLIVYDILGREVETLVNKMLMPSNYQINFNANGLPNGTYFYQLIVISGIGSFRETKKMLLLE